MLKYYTDESSGTWTAHMRPNASISKTTAAYIILLMALFILVIAMGFAYVGAWPVIVFAIATIIAVSAGFQYAINQNADYERLTVQNGTLTLETKIQGNTFHRQLNANWTHVVMESQPDGTCQRLALKVHGKEYLIGKHLCQTSKQTLGALLKEKVGMGLLAANR